jgi:cellulose synthase/poly-beta-1,6-N-acetylglucosamine synthase-like glycosyltransferase
MGWNSSGGQLLTRGGVLLHRREYLLEIDGYRNGAGDEELDLVVRLRGHLRDQHVADAIPLVPDVVAWTLAPHSARALARERGRQHRGELEVLRTNASIFTMRHGVARLLAPLHWVAVSVLAPLMELLGLLLLAIALLTRGPGDPFVSLFAVAALGYAMLLTLWAVALEAVSVRRFESWGEIARLCLFAAGEQVGFRQLVMWSRLRAAWGALRGEPGADRQGVAPPRVADGALSGPGRARPTRTS